MATTNRIQTWQEHNLIGATLSTLNDLNLCIVIMKKKLSAHVAEGLRSGIPLLLVSFPHLSAPHVHIVLDDLLVSRDGKLEIAIGPTIVVAAVLRIVAPLLPLRLKQRCKLLGGRLGLQKMGTFRKPLESCDSKRPPGGLPEASQAPRTYQNLPSPEASHIPHASENPPRSLPDASEKPPRTLPEPSQKPPWNRPNQANKFL